MGERFPTERAAKREVLLAAVERVRETILAGAAAAEENATLPPATVAALYEAGLFSVKLPAALGGAEADPVTQMEVFEAIARLDPSAGWCTMIGATSIGEPGAFLPDEAVAKVFAGGRVPTAACGLVPTGRATPVDGGYRLTGRWPFASGIRHAEWIATTAFVERGLDAPEERRVFVVPAASIQIHDNWQVAGLEGTGSCDFSATDLFVPDAFTWNRAEARPRRGGPIYLLGRPGFVANECVGFALGVGRCALDTITAFAQSKRRGLKAQATVASRPVFQRALGECDLRLRAVRALAFELYERAWADVSAGRVPPPPLQAELRGVATLATEVAVDTATNAFRYGGGAALYRTNILQRCLRDINAAAQHVVVSDVAYENHGRFLLGFPDADPLA
jgi:alkylation response protein AidB-like acyl-CoA dehydrogenase